MAVTIKGIQGNIEAGTYTPTIGGGTNTNITNPAVDGVDVAYQVCTYTRIGNLVTVHGRVDVKAVSTALTQLCISLPIDSNIGTSTDLSGVASSTVVQQSAGILGIAASNTAGLTYVAVDTTLRSFFFTFQYIII